MPKFVELPETDRLVKDLTDMLAVLNTKAKIAERFHRRSYVVSTDDLSDRARNIAQYLLCREVRP